MEKEYIAESFLLDVDYYLVRRLFRKLNQVIDTDFSVLAAHLNDNGDPSIIFRFGATASVDYVCFWKLQQYIFCEVDKEGDGPKIDYLKP